MAQQKASQTNRLTIRVNDQVMEHLRYWSEKHGVSISEYVNDAILRAIAWENKDYDLPTAEQQRLNQLIDLITSLTSNVDSLEHVIISGFDSLLGLTRGDAYLLDQDVDD